MPQFATNIQTQDLVQTTFTHTCPECGATHSIEDWSRIEVWDCECGKRYTTDVTGRVWEVEVPGKEADENGEPDATH